MTDLESLSRIVLEPTSRIDRAHLAAEFVRRVGSFRWVGLYDVTPTEIRALAWTGSTAPAFPVFPVTQGLNGAAVASRAPVVVQDVSSDSRYLTTFGTTAAEAVYPVFDAAQATVVGTLDVESDRVGAFTHHHDRLLRGYAAVLRPLWS